MAVETEWIAAKLENDAFLQRKGIVDKRADKWAAAEARPLREHVADWAAALRAAGRTAKHVKLVRSRVARLLDATGARRVSELEPETFQAAVEHLHDADGLSLQTCLHYVRAVKGFAKWLRDVKRSRDDRLAPVKGYNAEQDRRLVRRELGDGELTAVLGAAESGPPVLGMAGPDRAVLYGVALTTGLRADELRTLTPQSFDLDAAPPVVVVEAKRSKRRKRDTQPLPRQIAARLRDWLDGKPSGAPCFRFPEDKAAKLIRADLRAAREASVDGAATAAEREARERSDFLRYKADAGVADFHSLRHTFVSRLVRSGCNPKLAQKLARHSTPVLTLGRYAHAELADGAAALERVPSLPDSAETAAATAAVEAPRAGLAPRNYALRLPAPSEPVPNGPDARLDSDRADRVVSCGRVSTCRDSAATAAASLNPSARSSVGQSGGFLNRRSEVRVLSGVPAALS